MACCITSYDSRNFATISIDVGAILLVNFPRIKLSRSTDHRLIVINKNEPGMIGKIAEFIANKKLNISDMVNKSRDDIAINLIDLDSEPPKELIESLKKIEHVLSVRVC